ncbi:MAG: D-glucuronyl C5-epimerase domain protein [Thermoleophilia bacterium]|nr:D-glucuronyl C5-epimerase domain protein [Thermoleophilia bacterium]
MDQIPNERPHAVPLSGNAPDTSAMRHPRAHRAWDHPSAMSPRMILPRAATCSALVTLAVAAVMSILPATAGAASTPVAPTDPTQPTQPADPTQPAEPTQPADPTPPAKPAKPKDPVLAAIAAALDAKAITPAKAVAYRTTWRSSARSERTARAGARRANIHAVRAYATTLARRRGLTPQRLEPVFLTIRATATILGSHRRMPHHEQELRLPGEPLVFTFYSGRGVQFQPFESFKLGTSYLAGATPRVGAARRVADRMLELGTTTNGATTWEFFFPFGGPAAPWRSAIAQALGLRLYSGLAQNVPDDQRARYIAAADSIVKSFSRAPSAGGVASPQGDGSFYVMYSFSSRQRILNGHLESLLNLYRYSLDTGSTEAQEAYDRGYAALVPLMPRFDRGDWSNYQPGQEAEREYHEFMTTQFAYLARETRDPFFIDYARRFRIYLEEPASLGVRVVLLPSLVRPKDGYRDTIPVRFEVNKAARVTLIVSDTNGREQRRITSSARRGINTMYWDGRTSAGRDALDGTYQGRFSTVDRFGRRSATTINQQFIVEHDTQPPIPILATLTPTADGTGTQVTINVEETSSRWYEGQLFIAGTAISEVVRVKSGPITFIVPRPRAEVETATVRLVDNSGNSSSTALADVLLPTTDSG